MDIGERNDPALGRVNAALEVGWMLGRAYGFEEGYRIAQMEANDRWRVDSKVRIFAAGAMMDRETAAERKAARIAVLREGHAAGLHVGRRVGDCPDCPSARIMCTCTVLGIGTPRHERSGLCLVDPENPCANGCSDPAAHAEGAHDV